MKPATVLQAVVALQAVAGALLRVQVAPVPVDLGLVSQSRSKRRSWLGRQWLSNPPVADQA